MLGTGVGVVLNGIRRSREWLEQTARKTTDESRETDAAVSGEEIEVVEPPTSIVAERSGDVS